MARVNLSNHVSFAKTLKVRASKRPLDGKKNSSENNDNIKVVFYSIICILMKVPWMLSNRKKSKIIDSSLQLRHLKLKARYPRSKGR